MDFLGKLAALVPHPRKHLVRFHGVYAPNARLRSLVTPDDPVEEACVHEVSEPPGSGGSHRLGWARLMRRVFAVDALECPRCEGRMQTIAFVMAAEPIRKILRAMGYPADSPRVYPARSFEEMYELDPAA